MAEKSSAELLQSLPGLIRPFTFSFCRFSQLPSSSRWRIWSRTPDFTRRGWRSWRWPRR